ncbi:hypothetical protein JCM8202_005288 [Rhodotorula sphaerocarpa]
MNHDEVQPALVPPGLICGDVSLFRLVLVTEHWQHLFHLHGLYHYQTVGFLQENIEIGDLVILEAFDAALLRELCPGAVQAEKEWSEHLQVFKVDHLDSVGYFRLLQALKTADDGAGVSGLFGFESLPEGVQRYLMDHIKITDQNKVDPDTYLIGAAAVNGNGNGNGHGGKRGRRIVACLKLMIRLLKNEETFPEPQHRKRDLTDLALEDILRDDLHCLAEDFPHAWALPDEESVAACAAKLRTLGFSFSPASLSLPAHVASERKGKAPARMPPRVARSVPPRPQTPPAGSSTQGTGQPSGSGLKRPKSAVSPAATPTTASPKAKRTASGRPLPLVPE